jgi:hypothetical protein
VKRRGHPGEIRRRGHERLETSTEMLSGRRAPQVDIAFEAPAGDPTSWSRPALVNSASTSSLATVSSLSTTRRRSMQQL